MSSDNEPSEINNSEDLDQVQTEPPSYEDVSENNQTSITTSDVLERLLKLEAELKTSQERITSLEKENKALKHRLDQQGFDGLRADMIQLKRSRNEEKSRLVTLQTHTSIPPFQSTLHKFSQMKRDNEQWYSPSFYTHPKGYKMCLKVYPNGDGPGKNTHVLVSVRLMQGEFDSYLKWPFRGSVSVQLLNQEEDKKHHVDTLEFMEGTPDSTAGRVTAGERATSGVGNPQFFPHSKLQPKYLKHDCLRFTVTKVEFK